MGNLDLWDKVQKTDPAFTKKASKGQYNFTSISPVYQFKNATEQFGIQGIGWGVKIGSEIFTETTYGDTTVILTYDAVLFFNYNGERGEIPIHAGEKLAYVTNGGKGYLKIDEEIRKKVVTNAKTKGLSELGFNADIFMGQYEDMDYVQAIGNEFALEGAADKVAQAAEHQREYEDWASNIKQLLETATSTIELKALFKGATGKAKLYDDSALIVTLNKITTQRKIELEANKGKA